MSKRERCSTQVQGGLCPLPIMTQQSNVKPLLRCACKTCLLFVKEGMQKTDIFKMNERHDQCRCYIHVTVHGKLKKEFKACL